MDTFLAVYVFLGIIIGLGIAVGLYFAEEMLIWTWIIKTYKKLNWFGVILFSIFLFLSLPTIITSIIIQVFLILIVFLIKLGLK